jgi:CheY-specific phosphatase CheX
MSPTIIGNYIQLASHILVVLGFRSLTPEESTSIAMIIGLIGEAVGFLMTQFHATKAEDVTPLGGYKR